MMGIISVVMGAVLIAKSKINMNALEAVHRMLILAEKYVGMDSEQTAYKIG